VPSAIEFYFDFSSPYGYLAAQRIDAIAARHDRAVAWRPFLLGAIFKTTGSKPLLEIPLKGGYAARDLQRSARRLDVPFRLPEPFPFAAVAASRAFYWAWDEDSADARELAKALYHAAFGEGRSIAQPAEVAEVAAALGYNREETLAALADPKVKERLRDEVARAERKGVFGSPYILVDGEPFWGHDRLHEVETWLASGGW